MKRVTATIPTTVVMRVPNSWGVERAKKHLSDAVVVDRHGRPKFRRAAVEKIVLGNFTGADVTMENELPEAA